MGEPTPPAPQPPSPQPPSPPPPQPRPGEPGPPGPEPPQPQPDPQPPSDADDPVKRLERTLAEERKARQTADRELAKLRQQNMTEQERLVAQAREEGRAEALQSGARQLAASVFRELATAKAAALVPAAAHMDFGKFIKDDHTVDRDALAALVDEMAQTLGSRSNGQPPPARVPAGPMGQPTGEGDFLGQQLRQR